MVRRSGLTLLVASTILASPAVAQERGRFSAQAGLGMAIRSAPSAGASSSRGLQLLGRMGIRLAPHLQGVAELSLTRFPDQPMVFALLCPQWSLCPVQRRSAPGLVMAGLAAGLQPRLTVGVLELGVTTTLGGYWLPHRATGLPGLAPGARAAVGLGVPVGPRTRVILEASTLHLLARDAGDANARHVGISFSIQ